MLKNLVNHLNLETSQPTARARARAPAHSPQPTARLPLFFRSNPYLTRTFWRNPYLTRPSSHKILENRLNPYLTRIFWRNPYLTRPSFHKIIISSINPCLTRTFDEILTLRGLYKFFAAFVLHSLLHFTNKKITHYMWTIRNSPKPTVRHLSLTYAY